MRAIKRVSIVFRWIFILIFIALPIMQVVHWIELGDYLSVGNSQAHFMFNFMPHGIPIMQPTDIRTRLIGFAITLVPLAINMIVLYNLIRLFRLYEQAIIFAIDNVKYIRNVGYALLVGQLVSPLYQGMISALLTWHNPPGLRYAFFSFDSTNIGIIMIALIVILISWIMAEGCRLEEEHKYIV